MNKAIKELFYMLQHSLNLDYYEIRIDIDDKMFRVGRKKTRVGRGTGNIQLIYLGLTDNVHVCTLPNAVKVDILYQYLSQFCCDETQKKEES